MTNKYLEKIASNHMLEGAFFPAWQESQIAYDKGVDTSKNWGQVYEKHMGGLARQSLRSSTEATLGAAAGSLADRVVKTKSGKLGKVLGGTVGGLHGWYASTKNQATEAHKKYSE
jgi:hypothetical protein